MTTITKPRAKRYVRSATPNNFLITKRRLEVNAEIVRHGVIRQDHLAALFPDFPMHALYPTNQLFFDNEFTNRPSQQEGLNEAVPGRFPLTIAADRWAVRLHNAFYADPVPRPKYTYNQNHFTKSALKKMVADRQMSREEYVTYIRKNELSLGHLLHEINKAKTVLDYRLGARSVPNLTFHTQADMWVRYAPTSHLVKPVFSLEKFPEIYAHDFKRNVPDELDTSKTAIPLKISSTIDWAVKLSGQAKLTTLPIPVSIQPDDYFGHQLLNRNLKPFFFEHDEGSETILPSANIQQRPDFFGDTSLLQKLLIYLQYWLDYGHTDQFGITSFKVIIVTTTPERADNIVEDLGGTLLARGAVPHFVLVTDQETLARYDNNPYHPDYIHLNLEGDYVHLLDV